MKDRDDNLVQDVFSGRRGVGRTHPVTLPARDSLQLELDSVAVSHAERALRQGFRAPLRFARHRQGQA